MGNNKISLWKRDCSLTGRGGMCGHRSQCMFRTHHSPGNESQVGTLLNGHKAIRWLARYCWWPDQNLVVPFPSRSAMLNEQRDFLCLAPQNESPNYDCRTESVPACTSLVPGSCMLWCALHSLKLLHSSILKISLGTTASFWGPHALSLVWVLSQNLHRYLN